MTAQIPLTTDKPGKVQPITLTQFLSQSALRFGDRPALTFMGFSITYIALTDLVNRFAQSLTDLGVQHGDRVAIMLPNMPQTVVANYAILRMGAVTVMVNPLYTIPELTYQLNDAGVETLIVLDTLVDKAKAVWPHTPLKRLIVCHSNDLIPVPSESLPAGAYRPVETGNAVFSYRELQEFHPIGQPFADQSEWNGLATLMYTGGTTGQSKGVILTHATMSSNIQLVRADWNEVWQDGQERLAAIFPMFHVGGYIGMQLLSLSYGATLILIPRPEPDTLMRLLEIDKPTVLAAVPTIYVGLLNHPNWANLDLSFIKIMATAAAPMAASIYPLLVEKCPEARLVEVWGMTELSGFATCTPLATEKVKLGSVGLPLPGCDVKIVDITTGLTALPDGQAGEICFRGPQVMLGYWNKAEATADVVREGWLYSGDIGYVDEDGWLYIVDRKKDLVIAGGYNVYPREIDDVLVSHPAILEACCIGVPDAYRGETVKAFIVCKPYKSLEADEVITYCRERLAAYKLPRQIEFVTEIPKSVVGKILRREVRRLAMLQPA
ncbi:AMP-binding protein [Spirosoma sp. HMF4905]|uniref:AMP-binding protein n=1 Tax=Spirosoma arboris TaxID=2682092 RepID=A0A7K1S405_9BACT|nr:long-chain fatty acid--CoA ligase [Spirosoma arboris]MVM28554.1 AMP-binding protein [Spirosoma arboris]